MSVRDWLFSAGCLAFLALGIRVAPKGWRNEGGFHSDTPHPYWVWGERLWRAGVRLWPLSLLILAAGPLAVLTEFVEQPVINAIATGIGAVIGAVFGVGFITVTLFNRPKWMVAPHHRHQRGLIAELLGKRSDPTPLPDKVPPWHLEGRAKRCS